MRYREPVTGELISVKQNMTTSYCGNYLISRSGFNVALTVMELEWLLHLQGADNSKVCFEQAGEGRLRRPFAVQKQLAEGIAVNVLIGHIPYLKLWLMLAKIGGFRSPSPRPSTQGASVGGVGCGEDSRRPRISSPTSGCSIMYSRSQ